MRVVWCDKCSLFKIGVLDSCINAGTGGTYGTAIQLPPEYVPEGKDLVVHDYVQVDEDFLDWEVGWKVSSVEVKPSSNRFDTVIIINVGVH
jgi:hypothetical protein